MDWPNECCVMLLPELRSIFISAIIQYLDVIKTKNPDPAPPAARAAQDLEGTFHAG
ncbi:MAG: hypothetical protein AAF327_21880 [Cyanobacteria bacterium P01_A01_bin.37]